MKKLYLLLWAISVSVILNAQNTPKLWSAKCSINYSYNSQTDFSYDSHFFAIGSYSGVVSIYNGSGGQLSDSHSFNTGEVLAVAFHPKESILASADASGSIVLYDYIKKNKVDKFNVCKEAILTICFSTDGLYLYAAGKNKQIVKISVSDGSILKMTSNGKDNILKIVNIDRYNTIIAATSNIYKGLEFYKADNLRYNKTIEIANIQGIDVSPDSKWLAIATLEKKVLIWNLNWDKNEFVLEGHKKWMGDVAFSPVGDLFASSNDDKTVKIWNFKSKENIATITGKKPFMGIKFSPDGKLLAAMNEDGTVGVWDVSNYLPQTITIEKSTTAENSVSTEAQTTPNNTVNTKKSTIIRDMEGYRDYSKKKKLELFFNENKISTDNNGNVIFTDNNSSDISAPSTPAWKSKIFEINLDLKKYAFDEESIMVISYNPNDSVFKIQSLISTSKNFDVKESSSSIEYCDGKIYNLRVFTIENEIKICIRSEENDIKQLFDIKFGEQAFCNILVKDKKSAELIANKLRVLFAEMSFKYEPIK